ncbi:MAG: gephyrin-like molybdotransferase Glp [Granulosicoccus sp.]
MKESGNVVNDADPGAISIEEARLRIFSALTPCIEYESIDCSASLGRVIADDVVSDIDVPSFRASAMDGYAVRTHECRSVLTLAGQSLAGHPGDDRLPAVSAQRITTGARVPDDADAVVQQENVTVDGNSLIVNKLPDTGMHIREPGTDSACGSTLLRAGDRISASEQALLAAHGVTKINVLRKLRVSVFSTGDELVEPGMQRRTGQINDANRALLLSLLNDASVELMDLGIAADSEKDIQRIIDASTKADLVVSSGGVSVGDADHVKAVLENNGTLNIWKIAMKPGRPLTFGFLDSSQAFFGLPGNPVSAALTCLMFVRPAIDFLCGITINPVPALELPLRGTLAKNPGRVEYQRAVLKQEQSGDWVVTTTGLQDSHVLTSLHKANCLIELPLDSAGASEGDTVRVFPFTHFARSPL